MFKKAIIGILLATSVMGAASAQTSRGRADAMTDSEFLALFGLFMCSTKLDEVAQQARRDGRRVTERTDTRLVTTMTHGEREPIRRFHMEVTCEPQRTRDGGLTIVQRHVFAPMR